MKQAIEISGNQIPQISVVLPFHIRNQFLMDAIASVQSCSGTNVEIVCVADGLHRSEVAALTEFYCNDPRVKIIPNDGRGLVNALNTGIKRSSSPLIARMDSDDLFVPGRLDLQKSYLDSHPEISAVGGQLTYICQHSVEIGRSRYPARYRALFGLKPTLPNIAHPAAMFRKSVWESIGGYRSNFPHVEDLDFWNRCLDLGPIHNLKEVLIKYRLHPGQISTIQANVQKTQAMRADIFDTLGYVPSQIDLGPSLVCSFRKILSSTRGLNAHQRLALRNIIGFFATRESLGELGLAGGWRASPESRRKLLRAIWAFPIPAVILSFTILRQNLSRANVNWSLCPRCSSER